MPVIPEITQREKREAEKKSGGGGEMIEGKELEVLDGLWSCAA